MGRFQDRAALEASARRISLGLVRLGRYPKRVILAASDFLGLGVALWLAMSLRLGELYVAPSWELFLILCAAPLIGVATLFQFGLYRLVTRYIGGRGGFLILFAVAVSALLWAFLVLLSGVQAGWANASSVQVVPRSVFILYPILGAALVWGTRRSAGWLLKTSGIEFPVQVREKAKSVLIYGADATGVQLLEALRRTSTYIPVGFVDLSPTLWGQTVADLKVYRPERMAGLIQRHDVSEVLLAMPKARRQDRQAALKQLEGLMVGVRTLPAMEDLAEGRVTVSDLRPVEAEDLLGRDPVPPNVALLARNIADKSVLVTGAGGSIGSELVRQILRHAPRRLVLLDASEEQLYEIELEVEALLQARRKAVVPGAALPEIVTRAGLHPGRGAGAPDHRQERRRDHLPRRRLQARADRRAQRRGRPAQQHLRHRGPCRGGRKGRRGTVRAGVDGQGGAADQHHGRQQAPGRDGPAGARRRRRRAHRLHDGALRQCARQLGLGRAPVSQPDRGRRARSRSRTATSSATSCRSPRRRGS